MESLFYVFHTSHPDTFFLCRHSLVQIPVFKHNLDFINAGWGTPILMSVTAKNDWCICRHTWLQEP